MASTKKRKNTQTKRNVNTKAKSTQSSTNQNFMRDEIIILVSLAVCIFLMISHFNIGGFVGDAASAFLFGVFGFLAYIVPILIFVGIAFVFSNKGNKQAYIKSGCVLVLFLICCTLFQLIIYGYDKEAPLSFTEIYHMSSLNRDGGGFLGGLLVNLLCPAIGVVGTYVVVIVLFIISFVVLTGKSFVGTVKKEGEKVYQTAKEDVRRRKEQAEKQRAEREEEKSQGAKRVDKVASGVTFNTTLEKATPEIDMHEIEPPVESAEALFGSSKTQKNEAQDIYEKPTELVIDRATPIAEEEDFAEPEKEEPVTRKRRSTIESRDNAATEAQNVEREIKKSLGRPDCDL